MQGPPPLTPAAGLPGVALPPSHPAPGSPGRSRRRLVVGGVVAAAVIIVGGALALRSSASSKGTHGESFGGSAQTIAPGQAFTPQSLHQALLTRPFPAGLLPAGFSFDAQRSPGGVAHAGKGFSDPAKDRQHHLIGTAVLSLSRAAPGQAFQITFLSFDDPANADAYLYDVRGLTPAAAPDQPICGVTTDGIVAGCSVRYENVVVEGRDASTTGQALAAPDAAAGVDLVRALNQAGVTFLRQVKQS